MVSLPAPREIPLARVPIWIVLVALAAGYGSGYAHAIQSARAESAESALKIINAASDENFSRGVASALVNCESRIQDARMKLAGDVARKLLSNDCYCSGPQ